ncbi:origin recognition complex subunit 6-like protein [Stemphylium lycopersici]|uniref:Origin recognition complex subunit 6-like protein n=1 Tax=Stemphylium lycopersici TaxID=183478 RepID=A0A364N2S9_STELY|nr:origin recognition complex subunit 6-like protein [Stemphylium lycopersici]
MSRASIEQALTGLVPTLSGPLPPELIELALSLLTRSQTVATSMKSDEEIARPLKQRLNLPSIASRPPCPPRIYKKLYNYLSSALPDPTIAREPQTPRKATASAPASAHNTPKTPFSAKKTPQSTKRGPESDGGPPEWVMPAIRALAKVFKYPAVIPHVYTGVESIYPLLARMTAAAAETPSKRPRRATATAHSSVEVSNTRVLSLIVVVFLLVYSRMIDVDVSLIQYNEWLLKATNAVLQSPSAKNFTYEELAPVIEETMAMAKEEGWLQMQWFDSVKPQGDADEMEGVEMTSNRAIKANGQGLALRSGSDYIGLGTMMQDATDYLGERQQEDYANWKAKIMIRVQEIEAT